MRGFLPVSVSKIAVLTLGVVVALGAGDARSQKNAHPWMI